MGGGPCPMVPKLNLIVITIRKYWEGGGRGPRVPKLNLRESNFEPNIIICKSKIDKPVFWTFINYFRQQFFNMINFITSNPSKKSFLKQFNN